MEKNLPGCFKWDSDVVLDWPHSDVSTVLYRAQKAMPEIVFNTVALEGNPFTYPEVKTLLDGITVGGRKLSDQQQVLNQQKSWGLLLDKVRSEDFAITKGLFCELNGIVAFEEALKWGVFRDQPVFIAGTKWSPPKADELDKLFTAVVQNLENIENPVERGMVFFLAGAQNQFFYDGNKRTSRLMMNGELMRYGYDVINISADRQLEYNKKMTDFYDSKDATPMMAFLQSCSLSIGLDDKNKLAHGNESYVGEIIEHDRMYVKQNIGRGVVVKHFRRDLDFVPQAGEMVTIGYKDGCGKVSALNRGNELGHCR